MKTPTYPVLEIRPLEEVHSYKQGNLTGLCASEISVKLGFNPNFADDPDKVVNSWAFWANGHKCAIWDYRGSQVFNRFSYFGPREVFA
jgi:hypothetical protein